MYLHLKITGILLLTLAFIHFFFPRYFKWKEDLSNLVLINRQMMYVHTFFIALILLLTGLLCLTSTSELLQSKLGGKVALGLSVFWAFRLLIQFVGYSPLLWRGKRRETAAHIVFTVLWSYFTVVFFLVYRSAIY
jgi:hypothetical protein